MKLANRKGVLAIQPHFEADVVVEAETEVYEFLKEVFINSGKFWLEDNNMMVTVTDYSMHPMNKKVLCDFSLKGVNE